MVKRIIKDPGEVVIKVEGTATHIFHKYFEIDESILQHSLALLLMRNIEIKPKIYLWEKNSICLETEEWKN